ncbi:hypothetical protein QCN27_20410 [Cereibacter sp. SYSU M97828]|nr:hypothetical protein [Cereibacter flavus]
MKVWTITTSDDDRNTKTAIALSAEDADKAAFASARDLWNATKNMGPIPSDWREAIRQLRDFGLNDAIEITGHEIAPTLLSGSGLSIWSIMADTEDGPAHHVSLSENAAAEIARGVIEPIWQKHHEGEPMPDSWRDALDQMQERGCIDTVSIAQHQLPAPCMSADDAALIRELAEIAPPDSMARTRAEAMLSRLAA